MGADWKCDAIVGGNTCNLFNTNDGGLCSMHGAIPGVETIRTLRERVAKEECARIESKLWEVMETTPKDGLSGAMACIRGLVSLAKSVDDLRDSLDSVCEFCQDGCKCKKT